MWRLRHAFSWDEPFLVATDSVTVSARAEAQAGGMASRQKLCLFCLDPSRIAGRNFPRFISKGRQGNRKSVFSRGFSRTEKVHRKQG